MFVLALSLVTLTAGKSEASESVASILSQVYGSISTDCIQDADADIADVNRIAVPAGRRYVLYCHDGAGAGAACRCLQGDSTVDATAAANDGMTLFAGEKVVVMQNIGNTHISCKVWADDMFVDACPLD